MRKSVSLMMLFYFVCSYHVLLRVLNIRSIIYNAHTTLTGFCLRQKCKLVTVCLDKKVSHAEKILVQILPFSFVVSFGRSNFNCCFFIHAAGAFRIKRHEDTTQLSHI